MRLDQAIADLRIVRDFIPVTNSNRPRTRLRPAHITIHNTGNPKPGADAAAHARYMKGEEAQARQVSWHFTVDDHATIQSLPTSEIGWHAGPGNESSLGIEICMHEGMDAAPAYQRAAQLVAARARPHGLAGPGGRKQHHDWTGKNCASVLRGTPDRWNRFLATVTVAFQAIANPPEKVTGRKAARNKTSKQYAS
ncbi:MAG: N-acetylmuramoyl-L-alanine amidase, partial [Pseudorhodoplanes sp.]